MQYVPAVSFPHGSESRLSSNIPQFDCNVSFGDFSHVEAYCWNHVFVKVSWSNHIYKSSLSSVLQSHQRQFHFFFPKEGFEPLKQLIDHSQHLGLLNSCVNFQKFLTVLTNCVNKSVQRLGKQFSAFQWLIATTMTDGSNSQLSFLHCCFFIKNALNLFTNSDSSVFYSMVWKTRKFLDWDFLEEFWSRTDHKLQKHSFFVMWWGEYQKTALFYTKCQSAAIESDICQKSNTFWGIGNKERACKRDWFVLEMLGIFKFTF